MYLVNNYVSVVDLNNGCMSQFHTDMNATQRYEASKKVFSMIGQKDAIGFITCGRKAALVPGSDAQFERDAGNIQTAYEAIPLLYDLVRKDPVVYIHGALMTAGQMTPALQYYLQHGYDESEVFATSFSVGRLQDGPDTTVECIFAKEVRVFIKAVAAYTNSSSVNVIAYSLGSAVTRK
ncbi:lipase, partial [Aphelenchoides avenae]